MELETVSQGWIESTVGFSKGLTLRRFDPRVHPADDLLFPFAAGRFGSGANMSFRADVLRDIGGFDPALGAGTKAKGGDDLAVFFDVIMQGNVIVYEPAAIVRHAHRPDFESLRRQSFGYGVGLGAYLAHVAAEHPRQALTGLSRLRHAAEHFLAPGSARNERRPNDYPKQLRWRERLGVVVGPWSYARSRYDTRADEWIYSAPSRDYVADDALAGTDS
jgi:O-antigen biosynthesis protein